MCCEEMNRPHFVVEAVQEVVCVYEKAEHKIVAAHFASLKI